MVTLKERGAEYRIGKFGGGWLKVRIGHLGKVLKDGQDFCWGR